MLPEYLLKKATGELELVSGDEPFTVAPSAGGGTYDVFRLDNGSSIVVSETSGASASIKIAKRSNLQIAPEGVIFEVDVDGFDAPGPDASGFDARLHDLIYFWDFDDAGTFNAPQKFAPGNDNSGVARGAKVQHTFTRADTYNVTVMVFEPASGKSASAAMAVTVGDPEQVFGGPNTRYVDNTGIYSTAPVGAIGFTTLTEALASAVNEPGPIRIMCRGGQTHQCPSHRVYGSMPSLHITGDGNGEAVLNWNPGGIGSNAIFRHRSNYDVDKVKDFCAYGLTWTGPWDTKTETGEEKDAWAIYLSTQEASYTLVHDNKFSGFNAAVYASGNDGTGTNVIINDNIITNWNNFGVYLARTERLALTGNRIAQDVDALNGGNRVTGKHNQHGPIRIPHSDNTIFDANDMFNRTGWFPNLIGVGTTQPCIRWLTGSTPATPGVTPYCNIQRNTLEGGFNVVESRRANVGTQAALPKNLIIDGNLLTGDHMSAGIFGLDYGGVTIRNNIGIFPDLPRLTGAFQPKAFLEFDLRYVQDPTNIAARVRCYNNTFINKQSAANYTNGSTALEWKYAGDQGAFADIQVANNIVYQPNIETPQISDAPLDGATLLAPRQNGYQDRIEVIDTVLPVDVAPGATVDIPYEAAGVSQVSYDPDGGNLLYVGNAINSDPVFAYGATSVTITNNTAGTWSSGEQFRILMSRAVGHFEPKREDLETPADTISLYRPMIGSDALGDAMAAPRSHYDFFGNLRPEPPSRGALEAET